jgi:retron-type reverse transcriptase
MEVVLFFLLKKAHFYLCSLQVTSRCASRGQGGIISPTLANLALDGLEGLLAEQFGSKEKHPHRAKRNKVHYVRFADDFISATRGRLC